MRAPGRARVMTAMHEQTALAGLVAIVIHGITLLGDAVPEPWPQRDLGPGRDRLPAIVDRARNRRAATLPQRSG